jgi:DoxX-like family
MNMAFWIVSIGLALAFAGEGAMKLALPKDELILRGAAWINDFCSSTVRFVALTEILGGVGIILPAVVDMPRWLAPTSATAGLAVVMLGAAVIHARRRELSMIVLNVALLAVAGIAVWGRSGS